MILKKLHFTSRHSAFLLLKWNLSKTQQTVNPIINTSLTPASIALISKDLIKECLHEVQKTTPRLWERLSELGHLLQGDLHGFTGENGSCMLPGDFKKRSKCSRLKNKLSLKEPLSAIRPRVPPPRDSLYLLVLDNS